MIVRFKKLHPDAVIPAYSREGDAAVDLTAVSRKWDDDNQLWSYGTGISIEIPRGYVGLLYPRSSLSKYNLILCNHVGVIDSNYRGEIIFKFKELKDNTFHMYKLGDRIGQLIIQPIPHMDFIEVDTLTDTNRGSHGFGSSGN